MTIKPGVTESMEIYMRCRYIAIVLREENQEIQTFYLVKMGKFKKKKNLIEAKFKNIRVNRDSKDPFPAKRLGGYIRVLIPVKFLK